MFPPRTRASQACVLAFLSRNLIPALRPLVVPHVFNILDERGAEYLRRTREPQFGRSLEEVMPPGPVREAQWATVSSFLDLVASWLDESEGEWLGGDAPIYADLVLASHFIWIIRSAVPDGWPRISTWNDGRWAKFMDQCSPYIRAPE